jgi:hypothetical protein
MASGCLLFGGSSADELFIRPLWAVVGPANAGVMTGDPLRPVACGCHLD